jgi:hypothetical protein
VAGFVLHSVSGVKMVYSTQPRRFKLRHFVFVLTVTLFGGLVLAAAGPIGSVTSPDTFTLRGHSVPAAGIPNWPVMVGDEIATSSSPAMVQFRDGSRVVLSQNSKAKIEQTNGTTTFRLQSGSATFRGSSNPQVAFFATGAAVAAPVGSYSPLISSSAASTATPTAMPAISTAARATPKRPLSGR